MSSRLNGTLVIKNIKYRKKRNRLLSMQTIAFSFLPFFYFSY